MKIYSVVYTSFEDEDSHLYQDVKSFLNEEDAKAYFEKECESARDNAENPFDSSDEDDWYEICEEESRTEYSVTRSCGYFYAKVRLYEQEIN